jgi:hypothetical protein
VAKTNEYPIGAGRFIAFEAGSDEIVESEETLDNLLTVLLERVEEEDNSEYEIFEFRKAVRVRKSVTDWDGKEE